MGGWEGVGKTKETSLVGHLPNHGLVGKPSAEDLLSHCPAFS